MLMLISPAKSLDMQAAVPKIELTQARFLNESQILIHQLQALSPDEIEIEITVEEIIFFNVAATLYPVIALASK